jgi:pyrimidine-nucleoside phosphorylase
LDILGFDSMTPAQIIACKRDGEALSAAEIGCLIGGYVRGEVPDYQMSALAMAVFFRGMNAAETSQLTEHMLRSGETLRWSSPIPAKVDKHSTGGIGDKTSLILAPLLACCGLQVPMLSGRGLGPTGGTLDKLEAIPGFRTKLSLAEIRDVTERVGCVITGTTPEIGPADRKLYALRDVTATVESIPLITASIMSKKLAEGLNALVLDVKWGSGAFMRELDQARKLTQSMVDVGNRMDVPTVALLTDMNQPLGKMAGNAVEVNESLDVLSGLGPPDLRDLTLALGAELLVLADVDSTRDAATARLARLLDKGTALDKFREMVSAQGGDLDATREIAPASEFTSPRSGFVTAIDTAQLGWAIIELGGGRKQMSDLIDHSVGIEMLVRLGDQVSRGQPLVGIFSSSDKAAAIHPKLESAFTFADEPQPVLPLIVDRIV